MSWLYDQLIQEWGRWLPTETFKTIQLGAFYSVLVRPRLRIIAINGNYCNKNNFWLVLNSTDPVGQLAWLINELQSAENLNEKVHIIGHIPPGEKDCNKIWSKNYYDIINRYVLFYYVDDVLVTIIIFSRLVLRLIAENQEK